MTAAIKAAPAGIDALARRIGEEIGLSGWLTVDQRRIDSFADCTGDRQWIHVDTALAQAGPFGGTIAHGFLTLSLLPHLQQSMSILPTDGAVVLNYGLDKVRFLAPVRSGDRVRLRVRLERSEPKGNGTLLVFENTLEIEGQPKPALIAVTLVLVQ